MEMLVEPSSERQFIMYEALRKGATVEECIKDLYQGLVFEQMKELVEREEQILAYRGKQLRTTSL
jgi:carbamoyl-phosphate synthase large subunit